MEDVLRSSVPKRSGLWKVRGRDTTRRRSEAGAVGVGLYDDGIRIMR